MSTDPAELLDLAATYDIRKTMAPTFNPDFCQQMVDLFLARTIELNTSMPLYLEAARELIKTTGYKTTVVFLDYAVWKARSLDDYLACYRGWRGHPIFALRAAAQASILEKAEKIATSIQEWLALAEAWSDIAPPIKTTAPIMKCLRAAEKIASTPSALLECGTAGLMALPDQDGTKEMKRLYKKAVSFAACGTDWGFLAGAFLEESDSGLGVMPKWRARFDIRGASSPAPQDQVTLLTEARSAEEAGKSTSDFLQALTIYHQVLHAGQSAHFDRILGKAESAATTAHELAVCAVARFDCGWATLPARLQKAKNAIKKGIGLAHTFEDWEGLMAGSLIIAEKILRQEQGVAA
jgi:hypothetical protein